MAASKKGYVSFIVFFMLSLLVLLPLTTHPDATQPLSSSYASQTTLNEHIALKRAIANSSQYSYTQLKLMPSFNSFGSKLKEEATRQEILATWSGVLLQYNTNPNFKASIICAPPFFGAMPQAPQPPAQLPAALASLWASCASHITYITTAGNVEIVQINPKIILTTTHLPSNTSASSEIFPMELS